MDIVFTQNGNILIVKMLGDIDHHYAEMAKEAIEKEVKEKEIKNIIFDFSNVNFMDSAGIGMIIGRYKYTKNKGGRTAVACLSKNLKKIMVLSGLYRIVKIYDSIEDAQNFV